MSDTPRDDLRARMAQFLDRELVERAGARVAARAEAVKSDATKPEKTPAKASEVTLSDRLSRDVWQIAAKALRMPKEDLDPQENLANLGVDSIAITEIMVQISRHFAISVAPTTFFEARHLDDLAAILLARYAKPIEAHYARADVTQSPEASPERPPEPAPIAQEPPAAPRPAKAREATLSDRLSRDVWQIAATALRMPKEDLDPQENLANLGVDSIAITEIMVQISRHFAISVAPTTFFEARHLDDLAEILLARYAEPVEAHYVKEDAAKAPQPPEVTPPEPKPASTAAASSEAAPEASWLRRHRAASARPAAPATRAAVPVQPAQPQQPAQPAPSGNEIPIAILSAEGKFPKSPDLETLAAHLAAGDDCMQEVPPERWDWRAVFGDPKKGAFTDVREGGFVADVDRFDAGFFNISPREAELMDPQHRLFMECVWSVIEKGGYAPGSLAGRKIALFLGIDLLDYMTMVNRTGSVEAQQLTGLGHSFCPNRLSFMLDFHGPSEVIDTACSSSLVAIHRGVMSIRHEGCEMAIAGGSNLLLSPLQHILFSKVGMISPDGRCKTFSRDANGYARSDGVGAVLLKRLDLAERDGDPILGVIRGSVEHHGGGATSLTAPNPKAQAALIVEAHRQAGTDPRTVGLIECHGTGTRLGDPIEAEGLKLAFGELYRERGLELPEKPVTGIGSVKSNIGHTETAAGVAGLIKVVLALKTGTLFRSLHCEEPNPLLELDDSPLYLLQKAAPWKRPIIDGKEHPRRAGLSSFGAGGTYAHLVIEEHLPPETNRSAAPQGPVVVPVSAKNAEALKQAVEHLKDAAKDADFASLAYTLQIGRDAMRHRAAFIADDADGLIRKMETYVSGDAGAAVSGKIKAGHREKLETLDPRGADPETIARHWTSGGDVDWLALYPEPRPQRIALPAYPFQRKRYWLPETETKAARDTLDPTDEGEGLFALSVTGHEAYLADHKVAGIPVLPGVAYLELARAAAVKTGIANPVLRKVVWMAQLKVEGPTRIACEITEPGEGDARAEIFTQTPGGDRLVHAQMKIASGAGMKEPPRDLDALRNRPARHVSGGEAYAVFDAMGLIYGPSHRLISDIAVSTEAAGEPQVLARLDLPETLRSSLGDFVLHPGLMDCALQSAVGLALDDRGEAPGATFLPFSIESVETFGPLEARMWADVRIRERTASGLMRMDIDLLAEDGSPCVRLAGFTTRALEPGTANKADALETLRFEPHWRAFVPAVPSEIPPRHIVLLTAGAGDANVLKSSLPDADIRVLADDPAVPLDERFHCLGRELLAIGQAEISSGPVLIQLVLVDAPETAPLAALAAMMRSMGREHPKLSGQLLLAPENADLAPLLKTAASAPAGVCLKAEGAGLSMEVWEEAASAPEPASVPWRANGVYLITGGTGALGRALANRILETTPGATLVLASRSTPQGEVASWIAGTPGLHHICADVSDTASVASLVRQIRETHGKLDGVIHTAGVIRDEAFARKTPEQLAAVLAPKVTGAVALDAAIGDAPLDFLAFYSSISGVIGNIGQADYAAANSFLDAFAEARETRRRAGRCHGITRSVAWPLWRDGGMRIDGAQEDLMRRTTGFAPMETDTGLDALCAALAGSASRVAVTPGDAARIRRFVGSAFEVKTQAAKPQVPAAHKPADPDGLRRLVLAAVREAASAQLKVSPDDIDVDVELTEYGFDSISFTQFANRLNDLFDLELTPTLFFEYPELEGLAGYLAEEEPAAMAAALGAEIGVEEDVEPEPEPDPVQPVAAPVSIAPRRPAPSDDPVAVIGMSGQFPGAPDIDAFWDVLQEGRNCVTEIPADRWDWRDYWGDPLTEPGKGNVKWGGFISDIGAFDAAFFGITPPEARMMDPQQRLLLTESWRAMEDAGYAPAALAGSRTGVFIGTADMGYSRLVREAGARIEGYSMTGLAPSLGPNRISYYYDLHGPSVAVETACSSALIAVHRAVEAIRAGHCTQALAGGINTLLLPETFVGFNKAGMLSPQGQCKTFSAQADGYARGEGVGLVFLKSLSAAERDGDRILGLIRASAENHGGHAATLTAPNPKAQADLIRDAYRRSGIDPRSVGYIEAHGTGTPLGDPIEVEALTAAFADLDREAETTFGPAPAQVCALGSVKTNIGHLELAAGIAGLIKVLLQMRHGEIARSLHAEDLNPYLKLKGSPFHVAQTAESWPRPRDGQGVSLPRRAGVSSFGFGGTNAHVVVEEYVAPEAMAPVRTSGDAELVILSARSEAQLKEMAEGLKAFVERPGQTAALWDIACTLQTAREPMEFRLGFMAKTRDEMLERLTAYLAGKESEALHTGRVRANRKANAVLETDAPLREAAAGLAARGRAEDLLTLWVGGLSVDWASVRKGRAGRRIALPGYPFAKTRYWVGEGPSAPVVPISPAKPAPVIATPVVTVPAPVAPQPDVTPETRLARTLELVTEIAACTLEVDPAILDVDTELGDFGFDSVTMTVFASQINSGLGLALSPADFFEFATLQRLAAHIAPDLSDEKMGLEAGPAAAPATPARAQAEPRVQSRPIQSDDDPIVIVGESCAFPMAADAQAFWQNLISGRDCISRIPADRWSWQALDGDPRREPTKTNIHWGGFIDGVFEFDPLAFGISPREAKLMDPQQRLMLTHAWKAIEDAGHAPESLSGQRVGVFVGTSSSGYRGMIGEDSGGEGYIATGSVPSVGPNRISYLLDLHGPSEPIETACSSSLVALHRAVQAIRAGDCDMALVGGVNTIVTPEAHISFAKAGMLARDGRCKTFSADANGYVRGEGVGMLFVRRLSDAKRDGDPILAVVRGTAINHGGHANSLTAPNTQAQADLLVDAYTQAGIDPRTVGYIEAHGTGTALGDPVEINALKSAFRSLPKSDQPLEGTGCGLGSVKTNIGHLELAAGVAGVIKVLKQFEHRKLAPSLHCETVNPYIDLTDTPFRIQREAADWQPVRDERGATLPLRAGISSFGFGGVNAHAILEEYRPDEAPAPQGERSGPVVVALSARTPERLKEAAANLLAEVETGRIAPADMADLAFTLQVGRTERTERLAIVATNPEDLSASLARYLAGEEAPGAFTGTATKSEFVTLRPDMSPEGIAKLWTNGGKVDWASLDPAPHRRLRLPTTPFARDVYRAGAAPAPVLALAEAPAVSEAPADPCHIRLSADAFYVKDHVVRGKPILPGAMSLELTYKAALAQVKTGRLRLSLSNITWRRPVDLAAGTLDLTVAFEKNGTGGQAFRLRPTAEGQADFMRGEVCTARPRLSALLDIKALKGSCRRSHDPDWLYARYSTLGIDYGPAMRAVVELRSGDNEALAHLRVPAAAQRAGAGETFTLHPSLLDGAFQAALVAFTHGGDSALALPYGIDRVTVFGPTRQTMWAHLRLHPAGEGIRKLDIVLADEAGEISASIEGFSVRLMPGPGAREDVGSQEPTHTSHADTSPADTSPADTSPADTSSVERYFIDLIARETEIDASAISLTAQLEDYGIDSVLIMQLTDVLERDFGPLSKTLFFEHQTLGALIGYFREKHGSRLAEITGGSAPQAPAISAKAPADAVRRGPVAGDEPIAIIGLAGRYPGARNVGEFWQNLAAGRDSVTEVPATRWDHTRYYDPERRIGKTTCRHGGFIEGHDRFDPMFFNISPREARFLDPQERIFLQCAWEVLEDAGYTRETIAPNGDVGVFAGVMWEEYQLYTAELNARGIPAALAGSAAAIANRVSYFLNFHGPSIALDTMCSSSLTAIHLASEALRSGDCSVALAGGVNLTTHPNKYCALSQGRFLSTNGRCEAFGAGGDGYVPAEGVGAVLLKPLSKAEADGDRIYGVILASALNHGGRTNGFTVPNPSAQTAVIEKAYQRAGIALDDVSYIEAHGTGTSLGDPIEIAALTRAFEARGATDAPCAIGSVKSNIGHAESAAGMAGLTKILLQMEHGQLAPSIHAEVLNPNIDFAGAPFRVQQKLEPWISNGPRIAGLSSFGAGGSNAHLVIAEYEEAAQSALVVDTAIFPFSARDPERLTALLESFRAYLETVDERDLPRIAYTLQEGREPFEERLAIIAGDLQSLKESLDHALRGEPCEATFRARAMSQGATLATTESLRDIAAGWAMGAGVDWRALRKGAKPRPISLPAYPFAEEIHWIPVMEGETAPATVPVPAQDPLPLLYAPDWQPREIAPTGEAAPSPLYVLVALDGIYPALANDLQRAGAEVAVPEATGTSPTERYSALAWALLELLKDLARKKEPRILQVVVPLSGDDSLLEGLSGLLRSASLEHPVLTCRLITVGAGIPDLAERLEAEANAPKDQSEIRYIEDRRLVRHWREIAPALAAPVPWKENGVYLLTGGAGGIGLHVAEAIVASGCKPSLWLTGRSALKPEREATLKRLEGAGARVRYRRVDVTDAAAVAALIDEIRQIDGSLTGVFHGAGLTRDGLLLSKTAGAFTQVLAPKVTGVQALDRAIGDMPLDFLVLFGSAAGALGNPGQTDYAAANACLDAFAARRNARVDAGERHGRTVSIDWPYWRDGGMTMDDRTIAALARTAGVTPLETTSGLAALNAILAAGNEAQVLVLEGDRDRLRGQMKSLEAPAAKPASKPVAAAAPAPVTRSAPVPVGANRDAAIAAIRAGFSSALGIPEDRLGLDDTIDRFGVDSVLGLEVVEALEARFGSLPPTILFEFQTINRLADELAERLSVSDAPETAQIPEPVQPPAPAQPAPRPEPSASSAAAPETGDVAIIAVAGRFPDADTVDRFAELLRQGHDFITEVPADRADLVPHYSPRKGEPGASHCKWGAFLSNVDAFDAEFFGFTPRAADLTDPQERLFLETAWHLFERAGHTRDWLAERYQRRVGVFVGSMYNQYPGLATEPDARALLSLSSYAGIANRTSFFFDLQGPSVAVDSMCSSGLQAVHQAVQSLRTGECRLAVAGGINLSIHPAKYEALSRGGLVAADPETRAFSGGAGYLPAEAVGAVLLKPMVDALADGDRILAVIKGSLANHAGHSAGYAVPSVDAQERLLEDSFRMANIDPATISYIEAAATGSQIGDAIELRALSDVYLNHVDAHPAIGSVKANMGHAEGASGLAQLAKVLAQFERRELFPSFVKPGAADTFRGTVFRPLSELTPWTTPEGTARRATISSFGAGGSNVHLILEEAPHSDEPTAGGEPALPRLFPVSARTEDRLRALRFALADHLKGHRTLSLEALSRTLRFGRETFECEILLAATSAEELIAKLEDQAYRETGDALAAAAAGSQAITRDGPMLVLPGYPFKRERHWLKTVPAEVPAVSAAPAPETPSGESPLTFIRKVLAGELGCPADSIGRDTDLEHLGVDSMARMRLVYAIEEAYGVALTAQDMEAHPTPARLAGLLAGGDPISPVTPAAMPAIAEDRLPTESPVRRSAPERRPLGEAQKGLWVLHSLYPQSGDYNIPSAYLCRDLDKAALDKALEWLLSQYPILATRLEEGEGEPALLPRADALEIQSVTLPKELERDAFLRRRALIPFDLSKGVFRVERIRGDRLEPGTSVILIVTHHIVTDGVSSSLISGGLWQAYDHFAKGAPAPKTSFAAADYSEFVEWETGLIASEEGRLQKTWWLEKLAGPLPDLRLPVISGARRNPVRVGDSQELRLSQDLTDRLADLARELGASQAALYLSAFAGLLYRYTGERDLVIGVPTLRRPARRFAETLGFCANMIGFRHELDPALEARLLAVRVHEELGEALARGDYPFAGIARELGGTATGDAPYQATFAYQSFGSEYGFIESFAKGEMRLLGQIRQTGDIPFGIEVQNDPQGALIIANYDANAFARGTMGRMLQHYRLLLQALADGVPDPVSTVPMLTRSETDRALHHWSHDRTVETVQIPAHDLIFARARQTPGALAVSDADGSLTYKRLAARIRQIAQLLEKRGLKPGERVGVFLDRTPDAIASLLAVFASGGVWVPLDPEFPDERLAFIVEDAETRVVLSDAAHADRLRGVKTPPAHIIDLDRERPGLRARFAQVALGEIRLGDPAYVIYTSGSTGAPKGVVVSHGALSRHCQIMGREYAITENDVALQFAPASVDTALEQMLPILIAGGRLELRPDGLQSPEAFHRYLTEKAVTIADLPPVYLHELLRAWAARKPETGPLALRVVIVGGEALTGDVVEAWARSPLADLRLINAYGPTEATITALIHDVKPADRGGETAMGVPIGRPLPGVEIYILDGDGNLVPDGIVGELYLGGDRLAIGYHGRPALTQEKFALHQIDGREIRLYATGDLACFRPNSGGQVEFRGRIDDQVKIRGHRIELGEVEAAIAACGIAEAAVLVERNRVGDPVLTAYLAMSQADITRQEVKARVAGMLPAHMVPTIWVRLDRLPKTVSGKIDRQALRRQETAIRQEKDAHRAPRDRLEEGLCEVWAEVLGRSEREAPLGIDEEFSDAGGNSLLTVRLLGRIHQVFGASLSITDLAGAGTIAAQARLLRRRGASAVPAERDGATKEGSLLVSLRQPETGAGAGEGKGEASRKGPPLFLIHPVAGTLSCYRPLLDALTPDVPIYGLRAAGLEPGEDARADSIEALAARYLRQVLNVQQSGPYRLCGWSLGGVIAFEMARQLEEAGEQVSFLGLIDSYTPADLKGADGEGVRDDADIDRQCRQAFVRDLFGADAALARDEDVIAHVQGLPQFRSLFPGGGEAELRRLLDVFCENFRLCRAYDPRRSTLPITLVRAVEGLDGDFAQGWSELSTVPLRLQRIEADHYSILRQPALADWLPLISRELTAAPV